jgi:hypothetical protein
MIRLFSCVAVLLAGVLPRLASAAAPPPRFGPVVAVTAASADDLVASFRYLAPLVGEQALVKCLDGFLAKGKALEGLVRTRPCGALVYLKQKTNSLDSLEESLLLLFPVSNEKQFLALLDRLGGKPREVRPGLHRVTLPLLDELSLRFAHGHAYLGSPELLDGSLAAPSRLLGAARKGRLTATLRLAHLPPNVIRAVWRLFEKEIADSIDKELGNNKEMAAQLKENMGKLQAIAASFVAQVQELTINVDIDAPREHLALDLTLLPRTDNNLEMICRYLSTGHSSLTQLTHESAFGVRFHLPPIEDSPHIRALDFKELPDVLRQLVDPRYQGAVLKLISVVVKTATTDGLDACVVGFPNSKLGETTNLFAVKVRDGRKLDLVLRDVIKNLPDAATNYFTLRFNHARHGTARIHKVQLAGEKDAMLLAIRDDILILAGDSSDGMKALKDALDRPIKASSVATPALEVDVGGSFLRNFAPRADPNKLKLRVILEGGKTLRLRVDANANVLRVLEGLWRDKAGE